MLPTLFNYEGQNVRTVAIDGEPWFVAKDVCEILGLEQVSRAMSRLDEDERTVLKVTHPQSVDTCIRVNGVNEPGLYQLIIASNKPEAKQFKRWITHEVIPSIRKTGSYSLQPKLPQTYSEALRELADAWEENQKLLPKAESFDNFMNGENLQAMNVVAKTLGIGRNNLFKFLREHHVLMSSNVPYQEFLDRGYFEVKENPIKMGEHVINHPQPFATPKGVAYIEKLLKAS